jgi:hypothetical protein
MMLNSRVQVLNQFVRRHLNPKSIDHSSPPCRDDLLQSTRQTEKQAIFASTFEGQQNSDERSVVR